MYIPSTRAGLVGGMRVLGLVIVAQGCWAGIPQVGHCRESCREPLTYFGLGTAGHSEVGHCRNVLQLGIAGREILGLGGAGKL